MVALLNNDVFEVKFYAVFSAQLSTPRLHYRVTAVVGTPTDTMLADALESSLGGLFRQCMSDDAQYRGISVQRMWPLPKTTPLFDTTGQGVGGMVGEPLPKAVSGVIAKKTAFSGRNFRGRIYMPFPSEAHNDPPEGRPNATYMTALGNLATVINAEVSVGAGPDTATAICIIYSGTGAFVNGLDVVQCVARPFWGTQRRRSDFSPTGVSPI